MSKDVGKNFSEVSTNPKSDTSRLVYEKYNSIIVESIRRHFPDKQVLLCAELGGGAGALVGQIKTLLPEKRLVFTNIDQSEELLRADIYSDIKICSRIEEVEPHVTGQFDVLLMRYVLNYNHLETQKIILEKAKSLLKPNGIFILHHGGAENVAHKDLLNTLFSTDVVSQKLIRSSSGWTTWTETIALLSDLGWKTNILQKYKIPIGSLYKERCELTDEEEQNLHQFLGDYDFFEYVISENVC